MKKLTLTLTLFLFFTFFSKTAYAQNQENFDKPQSTSTVCSQESFDNAENLYNKRNLVRGEIFGRLERDLKKLVANCADFSWHNQAEEYLKTVQEKLAENSFIIARYYWKEFNEGKIKNAKGAVARLQLIIENYLHYSQMDDVKQLYNEVKETIPQDEKPNYLLKCKNR